jgi:hypothetical protein
MNDFKLVSGFQDLKDCKNKKSFTTKLIEYVKIKMGCMVDDIMETAFYLGTLIAPQLLNTNFANIKKTKKEIFKIHDSLYRFSITKIDRLMSEKYIGYLLKYFISNPDNTENIINSSQVSAESYKTAFELISKRSEAAISS